MSSPTSNSLTAADEDADVGARLMVFTWNLGRSPDALDLACRHLAKQGPFVAALQELPKDASRMTLALGENRLRRLSRGMLRFEGNSGPRNVDPVVELVASDDVSVDPLRNRHELDLQLDDRRRLEGVSLRSDKWGNLQVLGVHGWDRRSRSLERERADWRGIMRGVLDAFWDGGPLIVMGDMNANPWSEEITDPSGLYALRQKDRRNLGRRKLPGRARSVEALHNPMWQMLPDRPTGAHGTILYEDGGLRWHCFDQILVSEHLREHIGEPSVLTSLEGQPLIDKNEKPRLSDHLPVQMTVNIGKVTPCRVFTKC